MVDDDIIFNLSGTYDPEARDYSVSASSSMIRYSINGAFDASGNSLGSTATLAIKNLGTGEFDQSVTYVVTVTNSAVNVAGKTAYEDSDEYKELSQAEKDELDSGGVPTWGRGWWTYSDSFKDPEGGTYTLKGKAIASQWSFLMEGITTDPNGIRQVEKFNYTIVEMTGSGSNYEVILGYPRYKGTEALVDAAFKDFLSKNNLKATKWTTEINWENGTGFPREEGVYYVVEQREDEWRVQIIGSGITDWSKFDKWYRINYLETYLVGKVDPETWYDKYALVFNGDKSTMTATGYVNAFKRNGWTSIDDAKAANVLQTDYAQKFTR